MIYTVYKNFCEWVDMERPWQVYTLFQLISCTSYAKYYPVKSTASSYRRKALSERNCAATLTHLYMRVTTWCYDSPLLLLSGFMLTCAAAWFVLTGSVWHTISLLSLGWNRTPFGHSLFTLIILKITTVDKSANLLTLVKSTLYPTEQLIDTTTHGSE